MTRTHQITLRTHDGFTFYNLPDGSVADSTTPADVDIRFATVAEFMEWNRGNVSVADGERVRVHKNLHTGAWSIRAQIRNGKGRLQWKVIETRASVTLHGWHTETSAKGAERIRRNRCREVVACIDGTLGSDIDPAAYSYRPYALWDWISYNPYRSDEFHTADGISVAAGSIMVFPSTGSHALAIDIGTTDGMTLRATRKLGRRI